METLPSRHESHHHDKLELLLVFLGEVGQLSLTCPRPPSHLVEFQEGHFPKFHWNEYILHRHLQRKELGGLEVTPSGQRRTTVIAIVEIHLRYPETFPLPR